MLSFLLKTRYAEFCGEDHELLFLTETAQQHFPTISIDLFSEANGRLLFIIIKVFLWSSSQSHSLDNLVLPY